MHGNVWEWCWDWYGLYPTGLVTDPRGPVSGSLRVSRGGSWNTYAITCRSAMRAYEEPKFYSNFIGLRVARVVP
jgi:formylglycine-generating enzyme required for sulfatase activity